MNDYIVFLTVDISNNDRTVLGKAYAWRLLGMIPAIYNAATVAQCCYCGPDTGVAGGAANTPVPLMH